MYLTSPSGFGDDEPQPVRPGEPLPYRQAIEETERRQHQEYLRDCAGQEMIQVLERQALSPLERVQRAERVLRVMPAVFRMKREGEARVRAHRMSFAEFNATLSDLLVRMGFPRGYALGSEADELARARCALSKARWEFLVFQRTGRIPGRLIRPKLGEAPVPSRCANPIDATARTIVAAAQDQSKPIDLRGRELVRAIIGTYFPTEAAKVSGVQFMESLPGLQTTSEGSGPTTRGLIRVGRYFVEHTDDRFFARRVLQVGHELRHIDQWRAGMVGPARKAEREFLAHCWVALTPELPGTGCLPHATRVEIIDAALGNLNCLSATVRARYGQHERTLLALRQREQAASGRATTPAPATCTISQ
jgi:hypothetical protein